MRDLPNELHLFFDGSCEPNPGGIATGGFAVFTGPRDFLVEVHADSLYFGQGPSWTNNVAEYYALGHGLRWLLDEKWQGTLRVLGDSQLVIYQLAGYWKCNKEHLRKLRDRCGSLLMELGGTYSLGWIPREQNERCDALSREAYVRHTGRPYPERTKRPKQQNRR